MEIICVKVRELIYNRHNINLDGVPTLLKESSQKAIGSRSLVTSGVSNRGLNLIFCKRLTKGGKVTHRCQNNRPIKIVGARQASLDNLFEVGMNDILRFPMLCDPSIVVF
jgi:hypothetical protein